MQKHKSSHSKNINSPIGRLICNLPYSDQEIFPDTDKREYSGRTFVSYSLTLLLPKEDPLVEKFIKELDRQESVLMKDGFPEKKNPKSKHPLYKDGDDEEKDYMHGHYVFKAKTTGAEGDKIPLSYFDKDGTTATHELFYAGCWARIQFVLKTYAHKTGNGVQRKALALQFCRDDDPLFTGSRVESMEAVESYDAVTEESLFGEEVA